MSRRAEIADAAIRTLARDGMRGLTHRAVDRAAGLPDGSVSYYFRTRRALLLATLERLVELDITDMVASPGIPARPGQGLNAFADTTAAVVESWLTAGRERQLARYELTLEATRRPELRHALVASGAEIRAMVASQFAAAGVRQPDQRAADFVAFLDGLVFDQTAGAGARNLTSTDLRAVIGALLAAVTGPGEAAVADGLS
jgi:DNA-binding transcriptional regulator YbjK